MSEPDLDLIISKNTTSQLEKIILEYKINILRDLSENINVPLKHLKKQFLEKDETYINRYYGPDRTIICDSKCKARIWHSKLGPVQCSRSIYQDDFCKTHLKMNKRRYGRIDEKIPEST